MKWDAPETAMAHCTDNDKSVEVTIVSRTHDTIRAELQGMLLVFKKLKPGIYVSNFSGREFVIKTK